MQTRVSCGSGELVSNLRIVVWNEFIHERKPGKAQEIYPDGIHQALAQFLQKEPNWSVSTATQDQPEHGLPEQRLADTDVLVWWGHLGHKDVSDQVVDAVQKRVLEGMGLVVLHSGHFSKIFQRLLGTSCTLQWREAGEKERLWACNPGHAIVQGLPAYFEIPHEEMYGEPFNIPSPEETILLSWFQGGEVFRSGCCWRRGNGKIFYFRPGHETFPTYYQPEVQLMIKNGIRWAAPTGRWVDTISNVKVSPEGIRQDR